MDRTSKPIHTETLPWMPLGEGVSARFLRFSGEDRTLQLRVEPGTVIPPHAHGGEVHAYNIAGQRRLGTGEIAGPGAYVYEPSGNIDTWEAIGNEPVVIQITMSGALSYGEETGGEEAHSDTAALRAQYLDWCRAAGHAPAALGA